MNTTNYVYDGLGNRIQQKTGDLATGYLLDLQPGLAVILRAQDWDETDPEDPLLTDTTNYIHSPRGIHAHKDVSGAWEWMVQDGLGSVRGVVDNSVGVLESRNYDPYGELFGATGSNQTSYGFTGEPTDQNGLLYLRARYYNPTAGVFTALDPFEGVPDRPMSLNGYMYVEGNTPNMVDPSGNCARYLLSDSLTTVTLFNKGLCSFGELSLLSLVQVPQQPGRLTSPCEGIGEGFPRASYFLGCPRGFSSWFVFTVPGESVYRVDETVFEDQFTFRNTYYLTTPGSDGGYSQEFCPSVGGRCIGYRIDAPQEIAYSVQAYHICDATWPSTEEPLMIGGCVDDVGGITAYFIALVWVAILGGLGGSNPTISPPFSTS